MAALVPTGVGVWLATVALGQLLRVVSGPGTDAAFIAVSAVFLGLFLLGWRLAAAQVPSRPASRLADPRPPDRLPLASGSTFN